MARKGDRACAMGQTVPAKPTAIFCGKLMSREFTDGAYALRDTLAEMADELVEVNDEHASVAQVMTCIDKLLAHDHDAARGAIAALAHFAVISQGGTLCDIGEWTPLEVFALDDAGHTTPHPMSSYFDVAGEPVSLTPDLVALRWTADRTAPWERISSNVVRVAGKPISRKRFDAMRAALTA